MTVVAGGGGRVFSGVCLCGVCLSVSCLFFRMISKKMAAARITKLDTEMSHHESWIPIYFWGEKIKVKRHKTSAGVFLYSCECRLASSSF